MSFEAVDKLAIVEPIESPKIYDEARLESTRCEFNEDVTRDVQKDDASAAPARDASVEDLAALADLGIEIEPAEKPQAIEKVRERFLTCYMQFGLYSKGVRQVGIIRSFKRKYAAASDVLGKVEEKDIEAERQAIFDSVVQEYVK